jgi:acyl-CoA dehydrogenase
VTLARQLLKDCAPAPDHFPSEHLLRLRAQAAAKFADRGAGIRRLADQLETPGEQARQVAHHRLEHGVRRRTAAIVLHDQ